MALRDEYNMDDSPNKISLGLGVYRTEEGCPLVLESVKLADKEIHRRIEAGELNTEYLPASQSVNPEALKIDTSQLPIYVSWCISLGHLHVLYLPRAVCQFCCFLDNLLPELAHLRQKSMSTLDPQLPIPAQQIFTKEAD
eukprot:495108-Pleurochrysis_carterae.AAC.1